MPRMDWTGWEALRPKALKKRLGERLRLGSLTNNDLIALYNLLMQSIEDEPGALADKADALVTLFKARQYNFGLPTFLELAVRARVAGRDHLGALKILETMPALATTPSAHADLIELADDVWSGAARPPFPRDAGLRILASMSRVFRALGDLNRLTNVYLSAAGHFEDQGAIPAARRAARDAADLALETGDLAHLAQAAEQIATLAYREHDFDAVIEAGGKAAEIHAALGDDAPPWLLNTIATALMHLDRDDEAVATYEKALMACDGEDLRAALLMNLAACERKRGHFDIALALVDQARRHLTDEATDESKLELELIASRIACAVGDAAVAATALKAATVRMSEFLERVLRLHRRRMLRDRYVVRFEMVLRGFPTEGVVGDVLAALATVRGTITGDWLSLLDWARGLNADNETRRELSLYLDRIKAFGAPYLHGYREKYDDPWEPLNYAAPWDDLSSLIARLDATGAAAPYAAAATPAAVELIRARLDEGYAIIIPIFGGGPMRLWVLMGDRYSCIDVPLELTRGYYIARAEYQQAKLSKRAFATLVHETARSLGDVLGSTLEAFVTSGVKGLFYCQDGLDSLPITAVLIGHEGLRASMAAGDFEFRIVPAIYPGAPQVPLAAPEILSIVDSTETELGLAPFEAEICASVLDARRLTTIQAGDHKRFALDIVTADMVVVSTHGGPISHYTDPTFASMGVGKKSHVVSVEGLQSYMPSAKVRLALLNACHSGVTTSRGFYNDPRTYDLASYPSLILLDGVAAVSASAWPVSDTASYCFAGVVARFLAEGETPARALSRSIARLRDLPKSEVEDMIRRVSNPEAADAALKKIESAPDRGMFSVPYLSGGLQVFALM